MASARAVLTPRTYRRITLLALAALSVIVVSGAAVRLTGSGLGCSDWPTCEEDELVGEMSYHKAIEFGNRLFTGVVSVAVILAVSGSLRRRPYRRDLVHWSLGLVAGVLGQIVLGGLVVLFHLNPWLVLGHFQLSMVLVWNAVVLHHKAADPPTPPDPGATITRLVRAISALAVLVIVAGTVVTGSGPHTGSRDEPIDRLPFAVPDVARVHGIVAMTLVAATIALLVVSRHRAPAVHRLGRVLLGVLVAQAAIGYVQYFTDVPVLLVAIHIAGATALWITVVTLHLRSLPGRADAAVDAASGRPDPEIRPVGLVGT
jgi:cytochrome c oxidase assembly protein subunit 15